MKLYEISEQHKELSLLAEQDEIPLDALADTFEALEGQFSAKAVSVVHIINNMDSTVEAISVEIKRLTERKKSIVKKQESIREYLRGNMEKSEITKIDCPLFNITLAKGRDICVIDDVESIPPAYISVKVATNPDKAGILKALKAGEAISGAHLEKSQSSLRIK